MSEAVQLLDKNSRYVFGKKQTQLIKGIAILFMVLHHTVGLYYNHFDLHWYVENCNNLGSLIILFFSTAGKVCVPLLAILSGFGLAKSYSIFRNKHNSVSSDIKFIFSHLIQFYSIYWVMLFLNTAIRYNTIAKFYSFYGIRFKGVINFAINYLGLSKLIGTNGYGDWFASAIIILYQVMPLRYL